MIQKLQSQGDHLESTECWDIGWLDQGFAVRVDPGSTLLFKFQLACSQGLATGRLFAWMVDPAGHPVPALGKAASPASNCCQTFLAGACGLAARPVFVLAGGVGRGIFHPIPFLHPDHHWSMLAASWLGKAENPALCPALYRGDVSPAKFSPRQNHLPTQTDLLRAGGSHPAPRRHVCIPAGQYY